MRRIVRFNIDAQTTPQSQVAARSVALEDESRVWHIAPLQRAVAHLLVLAAQRDEGPLLREEHEEVPIYGRGRVHALSTYDGRPTSPRGA